MTMAAVFFFLLPLALFSALHPLISPVSACPDLPSMTVEAACKKATRTRFMYELCKDVLRDVPAQPSKSTGVDFYAIIGAKRALASYYNTTHTMAVLPGDQRDDAYAFCKESYRDAKDTMDRVVATLTACRFQEGDLGQVYRDGIAQVVTCRDRVLNLPASPLYARSLVDRNMAVLAYFLGKLLGIQ